jgi:Tfp pilus assembly protein PilF
LNSLSERARDNPKVLWLCAATERQLGNLAAAERCAEQLKQNFPLSPEVDRLP